MDCLTCSLHTAPIALTANRPIGLKEVGQLADVVAHLEVKQEAS
jgi:hypothetical protein